MREEWRDVVGYEGAYQVSSRGRVRTLAQVSGNRHLPTRILAPQDLVRYPKVVLKRGGKPTMRYIHRLVLEAFSGPCPPNYEARHLDGNRLNNCIKNLAWGTRKANQADRIHHGTACRGESHHHTTLSAGQVRRIRRRLSQGSADRDLATEFNVSTSVVGRIRRRESWRHLDD